MNSRWWTVLLAAAIIGVSDGNSETTVYPDIPKHLLECYMADGIYHRAHRLPNTYESILDLIRKIENSPTSRNMNARELSLVLLHYLKLDGIQSVQSHAKTSLNILPFAPSGDEYFKHRLTLVGLVTKIDQTYLAAINESLTKKEMCNLHFMISYSVDPYKRDNERCTPVYEEIRNRQQPGTRTEWSVYGNIPDYYTFPGRNKRSSSDSSVKIKSHSKRKIEESPRGSETLSELQNNPEDIIKSEKFTVGNQELLSGLESRNKGLQNLVQRHSGRYGGRLHPRYYDNGTTYSGVIPGVAISDCPVVNGIIITPYGSLAIGTVIAGIAAGLNPEEIPPFKLGVDPTEMENQMDRINNIWATTLAGIVADTISSPALLDIDNLQILKGGWNESISPKWYILQSNQFRHLTEVALRGSLDGLFLGLNAKDLTNKYSNFKLSQMLQMYYEYFWGNVGAKNRLQMRPQYAPDEMFRKQVHLMSLVLKKQKTNVLTVLDYNLISREAVSRVINFIQNMNTGRSYENSQEMKIDNAVNMVAVIDSSWGHEHLLKIFEILRGAGVAATPGQSNLTLICANDGRVLMSADNSLILNNQLTKEMLIDNCTRGMNLPLIFDSLDFFYRRIYQEEKSTNKINTDAQVLVIFPYDTLQMDNQDFVVAKSKDFQQNFPDVRVMVAANSRSEMFNDLVKNQRDIFTILPPSVDPGLKAVKDFAEGVKQSYQRISRPSCGPYFDDDSYGTEVRVTRDVYPEGIVHYRLLPQYFFRLNGEAVISIRSKQRAPLTVCHSRKVEKPMDIAFKREDSPKYPRYGEKPNFNYNSGYSMGRQISEDGGPIHCKTITSEVYRIQLSDPCVGAYTLDECLPLYISLHPPPQQLINIICPTCRLPFNVQFEISEIGLTCYNSATATLLSNLLLCLSLLHLFNNYRLH